MENDLKDPNVLTLYDLLADDGRSVFSVSPELLRKVCNNYEVQLLKSFVSQQKYHPLLNFTIRMKNYEIRVMIDSGSTRDLVDKIIVEKLNLPTVPCNSFTLGAANGAPIVCDRMCPNLKLKFYDELKGRSFVDTRCLDVVDLHGKFQIILGQPFLCSRNPRIDWASRTMTLGNHHNDGKQLRVIKADEPIRSGNKTSVMNHSAVLKKVEKNVPRCVKKHKSLSESKRKSTEFQSFLNMSVKKQKQKRRRLGDLYRQSLESSDEELESEDLPPEPLGGGGFSTAREMKRHMNKIRVKHKEALCALVILTVLPDGTTEITQAEQVCSVDTSKDSDLVEKLELELLKKKVVDRWSKQKIKGHKFMTTTLPGVPPVRFPGAECKIETNLPEGVPPPASKTRHLSVDQLEELRKQIEYYLPRGLWRPSSSPYAAPILFAPKFKEDGTHDGWRLCTDYRKLNQITKLDKFPLPNPETLISQLQGSKYFSKIDLTQFFHQIPMKKEDIEKTAISTRYGSYEWTVMPFGLVNAPATAVRFGAEVFKGFLDEFVVIFLDDILIFSKNKEEHLKHLELVLQRLLKYELFVKPGKCEFFQTQVTYLGLGVSAKGIHITDHRKTAIQEWPEPERSNILRSKAASGRRSRVKDGKTSVRSFLGVVGFFRKFIKGYAKIAAPLTNILKAENDFRWGEAEQASFRALKNAILNADVLQIPSSNPNHQIEVIPDASKVAIGGVLLQDQGNGMRPCMYLSKRLSDKQMSMSPYESELFAMVTCLQQWKPYLVGRHFHIRSDHSPLKYYQTQEKLTDKLVRQLDFLSEFRFTVLHIPGKDNTAADGLSRRPDHYLNSDGSDRICSVIVEPEMFPRFVETGDFITCIGSRFGITKDKLSVIGERKFLDKIDNAETLLAVNEILDSITIIYSDTLNAMMTTDKSMYQEIKNAYGTDSLAKNILKNIEKRDAYKLVEGLIFKMKPDGGKSLYIPRTATVLDNNGTKVKLRDQICFECHDAPMAGHLGVNRMSALIRRSFWWPKMDKNIRKQVRQCQQCQQNKSRHGRIQGEYTPVIPPIRRWSEVSLDFITDLPKSYLTDDICYDSIFVVMDQTSKRIHLFPFNMKFGTVKAAEIYFKEVVKLHGLPDTILSDRDVRFTASFWKTLWKFCGTQLSMAAAHHPQSNAANERVHLVIEEMLRALVQYPPFNWPEQLPVIEFAINNAVHSETGYTPFELDTGQIPLDPSTLLYPTFDRQTPQDLKRLLIRQRVILKRARHHYIKSREAVASRVNVNRIQPKFKIGDSVMIKSDHMNWPGVDLLGKHLKPPFIGPFKVKGFNSTKTAVKLEWNNPRIRVHPTQPVSRCHKYEADKCVYRRGSRPQPPSTLVDEEDDEIYDEIEKIVGKKVTRGITYYLVKWVGYHSMHNSWEPAYHLLAQGCRQSINDYEKLIKRRT